MALAATVFSGLVDIVLSHCRLSSTTSPVMARMMVTKLFNFHACFTLHENHIIESETQKRLIALFSI